MLKIIAPIVPHLAEEIHEVTGQSTRISVFLDHWQSKVGEHLPKELMSSRNGSTRLLIPTWKSFWPFEHDSSL